MSEVKGSNLAVIVAAIIGAVAVIFVGFLNRPGDDETYVCSDGSTVDRAEDCSSDSESDAGPTTTDDDSGDSDGEGGDAPETLDRPQKVEPPPEIADVYDILLQNFVVSPVVNVDGNTVSIRGTPLSESRRDIALGRIEDLPGVLVIEDELDEVPGPINDDMARVTPISESLLAMEEQLPIRFDPGEASFDSASPLDAMASLINGASVDFFYFIHVFSDPSDGGRDLAEERGSAVLNALTDRGVPPEQVSVALDPIPASPVDAFLSVENRLLVVANCCNN